MSRHHHRFERDYRAPWERRDIRLSGLHNGGANHSCASAVVNGNNRPGLLPLPIIPSLLPTPTAAVVTTAGSEVAAKRGIAAAGSVTSASTKVRDLRPSASVEFLAVVSFSSFVPLEMFLCSPVVMVGLRLPLGASDLNCPQTGFLFHPHFLSLPKARPVLRAPSSPHNPPPPHFDYANDLQALTVYLFWERKQTRTERQNGFNHLGS